MGFKKVEKAESSSDKPCGGTPCGGGVKQALDTAWSFSSAIAYWAARGFRTATQDQYDERRSICRECPKLIKSMGVVERCAQCRCIIALKAGMIQHSDQSDCPLAHWPVLSPPEETKQEPESEDEEPEPRVIRPVHVPTAMAPSPQPQRVLISMHKGLGDSMCLRAALFHIQQQRPNWTVDVYTHPYHTAIFEGICNRVRDDAHSRRNDEYDVVHTPPFMRPRTCVIDAPCNTVQQFLISLGVKPVAALSGYGTLTPSPEEQEAASRFLTKMAGAPLENGRHRVVLIHQLGRSYANNKNPDPSVWHSMLRRLAALGYVPVAVNFDGNSEAVKAGLARSLDLQRYRHPQHGTSLAALVQQSSLFVGVDSGPLHVAGACPDTPAIGVWLRHHPIHSYNIAAHVTHLVPQNHADYLPKSLRDAGLAAFEKHYSYKMYDELSDSLAATAEEALTGDELIIMRDCWVRKHLAKQDWFVVNEVWIDDVYRLKEMANRQFSAVLDIGAHIGTFSRLCRRYWPKTKIVAVEALQENAAVYRKNDPRGHLIVAGCTFDAGPLEVSVALGKDLDHTGGSKVSVVGKGQGEQRRSIPRITLDELVEQNSIDPSKTLLKMDCEGAEFSILEHSKYIHQFPVIIGEWHDRARFYELYRRRFSGWKLTVWQDHQIGVFKLERPQ